MTPFTPDSTNTDPDTPIDDLTVTHTTDIDAGVGTHVTISLHQARQIGELLDVCDDLLRNGSDQVRTDLVTSMLLSNLETLDWAWFIDMVGLSARYLHARTARAARHSNDHHVGQDIGQAIGQGLEQDIEQDIVVLPH